MLASRARALLDGRLAPSVDDVVALARPVLRHRMALNFAARADGVALGDVIDRLVERLAEASPRVMPLPGRASGAWWAGAPRAGSGPSGAHRWTGAVRGGDGYPAGRRRPARRAEALGARLPPLLVAAERVAATVAQGVHGRRRVGQGDSFWQFRPFVAGRPDRPHRLAAVGEVRPPGAAWLVRARDRVGGGADRLPVARRLAQHALALAPVAGGKARARRTAAAGPGGAAAARRRARDADRAGGTRPSPAASASTGWPPRWTACAGADIGLPPHVPLPRHASVVLIGDFLAPLEEIQAGDRPAQPPSRSPATCCRCSTRPRSNCPTAAASASAAWSTTATP